MAPASKTIKDTYEILDDIGRGGMAQVYKARQLSLGRMVAIKEIKPAIAASPELVERFKREARTAASLIHENIVQVYNFGEPREDSLFIVMEYVEGFDLKSLLARSTMVPPRIAAIVIREVARALAYAHARGLIHRDVKPGNVMVSNQGEVKLMDFGIVREMDSDLTKTGAFLGTPNYMAPEQFLGEEIAPATDLFSLGVVLFEILTGQKPWKADGEGALAKKVRLETEPRVRSLNPSVPRRLQKIAHLCLRKKPARRPADAEELARMLDRVIGNASREEQRRELAAWVREITGQDREPTPASASGRDADSMKKIRIRERSGPGVKKSELSEVQAKTRVSGARGPDGKKPVKSARVLGKTGAGSGASAAQKPAADQPAPDRPEPIELGEAIMKWTWRLILLAIALLAAITVFLIFNPAKNSAGPDHKDVIERIIDRLRPGPQ
ncbi:MAG TPA: serine/threonine-protein kinase [bacterium]|nr:serine/threonine-protein kinase [bacterium]